MHLRVSVNLGSGRLEDAGPNALGQTEHIDDAHDAGLHRLYRVVLVMNRGRRTGEVIDLVYLKQNRFDNVVPQKFKTPIVQQVRDVLAPAREKVVEADNFIVFREQTLAEV